MSQDRYLMVNTLLNKSNSQPLLAQAFYPWSQQGSVNRIDSAGLQKSRFKRGNAVVSRYRCHRFWLALSLAGLVGAAGLSGLSGWSLHPTALKHYQQAIELERKNNLPQAILELRSATTLAPEDPLILIKLANLLHQQGQNNEALALYATAAKLSPNDPMIDYSCGAIEESQGHYAKAEAYYESALKKNPNYTFGLMSLSRIQAQQGQFNKAITGYQSFLVQYPEHYDARRNLAHLLRVTNQNTDAVKEYEQLKALYPQKFSDHLALAKALNKANEPDRALMELKVAYALEGKKADITAEMGNAHAALGQVDYAIQNYEKAIALNPEDASLSLKLAELYLTQKDPRNAITHYQAYLKRFPENESAQRSLVYALIQSEDYTQAVASLKPLIEKSEAEQRVDDTYQLKKQLAYAFQMNSQPQQAIAVYEQLANSELGRDDAQVLKNLAIAYHQQGTLEKAVPLYEKVYETNPTTEVALGNDLALAHIALGDLAYAQKQWQSAETHYQAALKTARTDNLLPALSLSRLYLEQRKSQPAYARQARESLEKLLTLSPNGSEPYLEAQAGLGQLDLEAGLPDKTILRLEALQLKYPTSMALYHPLTQAYLATQQTAKIKPLFEQGLLKQPTRVDLYISYADALSQMGQAPQAQEKLNTALGMSPQAPELWIAQGQLAAQQGQWNSAEVAYRKALTLKPDAEKALYGLAQSLDKQNKAQEALGYYEYYSTRYSSPSSNSGAGSFSVNPQSRIQALRNQLNLPPYEALPSRSAANTSEPVMGEPANTSGNISLRGQTSEITSTLALPSASEAYPEGEGFGWPRSANMVTPVNNPALQPLNGVSDTSDTDVMKDESPATESGAPIPAAVAQ